MGSNDVYLIGDINVRATLDKVTNGQDIALLRCIVQWSPSVLQGKDMKEKDWSGNGSPEVKLRRIS